MKTIVITIIVTLALSGVLQAGVRGPVKRQKVITPYGDFCPRCSKYGIRKRQVRMHEAVEAARAYFGNRGLRVGKVAGRGRFIVMDIYSDGKLVDRVVFDRRSGRLRSIY